MNQLSAVFCDERRVTGRQIAPRSRGKFESGIAVYEGAVPIPLRRIVEHDDVYFFIAPVRDVFARRQNFPKTLAAPRTLETLNFDNHTRRISPTRM